MTTNSASDHTQPAPKERPVASWPLLLAAAALAVSSAGCSTVKPWERDAQALAPMQLDDMKCHRFERNVEVYREGAVGANGGKSGGGCGCS